MKDREPKSREERPLTMVEKQITIGQLIVKFDNRYGKNRFGGSMVDYAKNPLLGGGLNNPLE